MSIARLNRMLLTTNLVCHKHPDYFYFVQGADDEVCPVLPTSVYVRRFTDLSLDEWMRHAVDAQRSAA